MARVIRRNDFDLKSMSMTEVRAAAEKAVAKDEAAVTKSDEAMSGDRKVQTAPSVQTRERAPLKAKSTGPLGRTAQAALSGAAHLAQKRLDGEQGKTIA